MALKQAAAMAAIKEAAGEAINKSMYELAGGWLLLVPTDAGRRLAYAYQGETAVSKMWKGVIKSVSVNSVQVDVMELNANNAAVVRRFLKWTAPKACGTKGASVGFSDWLGAADAFAAGLFSKRRLKPVLVDFTPEDSAALQRNFLEAVDTVTWGVLEAGYKDGYGANAAGLKTEEDIVKALLYGYSMIGYDCSEKIDLTVEKLSDEAVEKRFSEFNDTFRAAVDASYLNAEFKTGTDKIAFAKTQLHRIILEFGEAIMHVQFIYNSYLKNTPWDIDFELLLSKPGRVLTPQEHYLIANELQRNGIKLAAICLDPFNDESALAENLRLHCAIADIFGYRLSLRNADLAVSDPAAVLKYLKGNVHFKLNNILWLSALKLIAELDGALYARICAAAGTEAVAAEKIGCNAACKALALSYKQVLNPAAGSLAAEIKAFLAAHRDAYAEIVRSDAGSFLKKI